MPKKLNISSNERVDLEDFNRASVDYTQESDNFERQKLVQARRSLVASGFRIEVSDQTTAPGEFTIYNGLSLDRSGNLLNNEQQVSDARTMTLSGASTTFYIEIEFVEGESDVDTRAFWDPTFSGNTPPGKEFSLNVATRVTPDWQVVSVTNTTGMTVDTADVNSARVPISVLQTNGANEIVHSAVNASTVLEEDVLAAVDEIRVLDSTLFPTNGDATLDLGGDNPETVSIIGNDLVNGIITLGGPTGFAHNAGAIFIETVVPASFIPEGKFPAPSGVAGDRRRRLYAGDANRGGALAQDSQDFDARSDLAVKSLKDHVDFLAAQIQEMKFGSLRFADLDTIPPSSAPALGARYYDKAGSLYGARSSTCTIGDSVNSFGDINSFATDLGAKIAEAHTALPSTGGTILVKTGSYGWGTSAVTFTKPVNLVFEKSVVTLAVGTSLASLVSTNSDVSISNFPEPSSTPSTDTVVTLTAAVTSSFVDSWMGSFGTLSTASEITALNCVFVGNSTISQALEITGTVGTNVFRDCTFRYEDTSNSATDSDFLVLLDASSVVFDNCEFDAAYDTGACYGWVLTEALSEIEDLRFSDCKFFSTNDSSAAFQTGFQFLSTTLNTLHVSGCNVTPNGFTSAHASGIFNGGTLAAHSTVDTLDVRIENCDFTGYVHGAATGDCYHIAVNSNITQSGRVLISGNEVGERIITGTTEGVHPYDLWGIFVGATNATSPGDVLVSNNSIYSCNYRGIYVSAEGSIVVSDNTLRVKNTTSVTDAMSCIYVANQVGATIVGNTIDVTQNSTDFDVEGIRTNSGAGAPTSAVAVSANTISLINTTSIGNGQAIGIVLSDSFSEGTAYAVTGNIIEMQHDGVCYGMQLWTDRTDFMQPLTVSGNTISQQGVPASSAKYGAWRGIWLTQGGTSDIALETSTVTGNTIRQKFTNTITPPDSTYGIYLSVPEYYLISDNMIHQHQNGTGDEQMFGIYSDGSDVKHLSITGNSILADSNGDCDDDSGAIYLGFGQNNGGNNIQICNNKIFSTEAYAHGIIFAPGSFGSTVVDHISINGNQIQWLSSSPTTGFHEPGGILMGFGTTGTEYNNLQINNNNLKIDPDGSTASSESVGIGVLGGSVGHCTRVQINSNNITFTPDTSVSTTAGGGMYVSQCEELQVVGNLVAMTNQATVGVGYRFINIDGCAFHNNTLPDFSGATTDARVGGLFTNIDWFHTVGNSGTLDAGNTAVAKMVSITNGRIGFAAAIYGSFIADFEHVNNVNAI